MTISLVRLSICECGFPTVNEGIPLGTEYDANPDKIAEFTYVCGGCHEARHVVGVWCEARTPEQKPGYLPVQLFDWSMAAFHLQK